MYHQQWSPLPLSMNPQECSFLCLHKKKQFTYRVNAHTHKELFRGMYSILGTCEMHLRMSGSWGKMQVSLRKHKQRKIMIKRRKMNKFTVSSESNIICISSVNRLTAETQVNVIFDQRRVFYGKILLITFYFYFLLF